MLTTRRRILQIASLSAGGLLDRRSERVPRRTRGFRFLVPAYFRPSGAGLRDWERLLESARQVPIVAIVNLANGPGQAADPDYRALVERARRAKLTLVGYVHTGYASRALQEVEADVRRWAEFYPDLNGIFYDLQPSDAVHVGHYLGLRKLARACFPAGLVVSNPGTVCAEDYLSQNAADVFCVFEDRKGFEGFRTPGWAVRYRPERFAALPYQVEGVERMREFVAHARAIGVGYLYVTDRGGSNPWDGLPSYWNDEVRSATLAKGSDDATVALPRDRAR